MKARQGFKRLIGVLGCLVLAACGTLPSSPGRDEAQGLSTLSTGGELTERGLTTPTGWYWLTGVTAAQITAKINEGYRLFDIEVDSAAPIFSAVFVKNTGVHAKGFWWYYGQTDAQVASLISNNKARIIDREIYYVGGQKLNAVVMLPNSGSAAKSWYYFSGLSFAGIGSRLAEHPGYRLVDLDSYVVGSTTYYSVVMVENTGVDAKSWWYYVGVTPAQISTFVNNNGARITDLERRADGKYTVIMERSQGESWWWYYGLSAAQVNALTAQNGARLIDVERYGSSYAVVMLDNLNAQSRRMANLLKSKQSGGNYGLYVKQISGSPQAGLMESFVFEPASTIKALHHVHAMRRVALGSTSLASPVSWFTGSSGSCPTDSGAAVSSLQTGLKAMMEQSDNRWTQAMRVRFGEASINATAQALGMSSTLLRHRIGCAGGADGAIAEPNRLTLVDAAKLYEAVANGYLLTAANRDTFYSLMPDGIDGTLNTVISQEAAATGVSGSALANFKARVTTAAKAGSYGLSGKTYTSIAGSIKLPFKSGSSYVYKQYAFGLFFNNASSVSGSVWTYRAELLREQIRAALNTF